MGEFVPGLCSKMNIRGFRGDFLRKRRDNPMCAARQRSPALQRSPRIRRNSWAAFLTPTFRMMLAL